MDKHHQYKLTVKWTGNNGFGTTNYKAFERSHTISVDHKVDILGSSDPDFRGDKTKHNPEELLLASISACHMLWYLHLCAEAGLVILDYIDHATAVMIETTNGGGKFAEATLHPIVTLAQMDMEEKANQLHTNANELCFIANSLNFTVQNKPTCISKNLP